MNTMFRSGERRRDAMTLIELLVTIAIIALLVGLILPAVQKVRESANAIKCKNNLHQIGLALAQYHDGHGSFPPGVSWANGKDPFPHMTWLTRLLPYIEQNDLWTASVNAFRQEAFFEYDPHLPILSKVIPVFTCPSDSRSSTSHEINWFRVGLTSYMGVEGTNQDRRDGILFLDSRIGIADIADGSSNTLLVGERPANADMTFGWWYAGWGQSKDGSCDSVLGTREIIKEQRFVDCPVGSNQYQSGRADGRCDMFHFWSFHPGGANFLFADGSVRFLSYSANPIMPALASRAGGEVVEIP
jgi:prepilin-type processing-associated H-X9-DG protein/prepilin-type N-terminal cleavage/methylation domain-containing protein